MKVLDFGLAKATGPDLPHSPTITVGGTQDGVILGTAAYMSPEQARGQAVDKRTDIWAFGCVLYEMLTGRIAFDRGTVSDTIAAIIEREPDWSALPPSLSPTLKIYLQRCLQKNPRNRVHDVADLRLALEGAFDGPRVEPFAASPKKSSWRKRSLTAIAAVALVGLGATIAWLLKSAPSERPAVTAGRSRQRADSATRGPGARSKPGDGAVSRWFSPRLCGRRRRNRTTLRAPSGFV